MPLFFFIIGFILIDSGFRGNARALYDQFASDAKGFVAFFAIIVILGAMGVSSSFRPISKGLLALVFVVFFVRKGNQIVSGIQNVAGSGSSSVSFTSDAMPAPAQNVPITSAINNTSGSSGSGMSSDLAMAGEAAMVAMMFM